MCCSLASTGVDPGPLPVSNSKERFAGVEVAADSVERVAGASAVAEGVLLDALPTPVYRVAAS